MILPMLNLAGLGIAFHAKPTVTESAELLFGS
jgi:phosphoserine phosphatase